MAHIFVRKLGRSVNVRNPRAYFSKLRSGPRSGSNYGRSYSVTGRSYGRKSYGRRRSYSSYSARRYR